MTKQPKTNRCCPACGQVIVLPDELKHLGLLSGEMLVLTKLILKRGRVVRYTEFHIKGRSLYVYISHLRAALLDIGAPYLIVNTQELGYSLVDIPNAPHPS